MFIEQLKKLIENKTSNAIAVRGTDWLSIKNLLETGDLPVHSNYQELCWWPILENWNSSDNLNFANEGAFRLVALDDEQLKYNGNLLMEESKTIQKEEYETYPLYNPNKLAADWAKLNAWQSTYVEHGLKFEDYRRSYEELMIQYSKEKIEDLYKDAFSRKGFLIYLSPIAKNEIEINPDPWFSCDDAVSIITKTGRNISNKYIHKIHPLGDLEKEQLETIIKEKNIKYEDIDLSSPRPNKTYKKTSNYETAVFDKTSNKNLKERILCFFNS